MSKTLAPSVTTRDPKGGKFISIVEAQYNKAGLSEKEAQRLNDTPGLAELIANFITENRVADRFWNEEMDSNFTYPPEYRGPKSIERQVAIMLADKNFPGLDPEPAFRYYRDVYSRLVLPDWVEGAFVVPANHVLATRFFPEVKGLAEQYCSAVNLVLAKIAALRKFYNYRGDQITTDHLRLWAHTTRALTVLAEQQPGDFWIIPSQFGLRHRGRSVRRAREKMDDREFGGYIIQVGSMLLTHPERLVRCAQLHIGLPGDEFRAGPTGRFGQALSLYFYDGRVEFDTSLVGDAYPDFGSASGFLPQ